MPKLEVRVSAERLARWREVAGGESLSAWVRRVCDVAAGRAGLGLAERTVPMVEPRRTVPEHRSERLRAADAAVAAMQGGGVLPASVAPPVEEPPVEVLDPMRAGRCRDHPGALPRWNDLGRCSWGCRLPPD